MFSVTPWRRSEFSTTLQTSWISLQKAISKNNLLSVWETRKIARIPWRFILMLIQVLWNIYIYIHKYYIICSIYHWVVDLLFFVTNSLWWVRFLGQVWLPMVRWKSSTDPPFLKPLKATKTRYPNHNLQGKHKLQGSYVHTCFWRKDHGTSWHLQCWEAVGCWNEHVPQPSQMLWWKTTISSCHVCFPLHSGGHSTEHCENDTSKTLSWISDHPNRSKTWWLILNVSEHKPFEFFRQSPMCPRSSKIQGYYITTSYRFAWGTKWQNISKYTYNHRKRSGRSIAYSLFVYAWARYLSSTLCWVVYFGSWNGLPKHAVHRVYIHMKIFAGLQVPRKLHLKHLNASELIVSTSTYVEIAFTWWQSMTKPLRTSGGHRWQVHPQKILGWIFGPSTICTLLPSSKVHPQIPMVTIPECQRRAMSQKSWWAYTRSWLPRNILYMLIWQATKNML